ncbi:kti12, chromatin associated [Clydaea vesicula]|uniref:Kti12, chromatin associated n=1 Tax=Clydaea vesicula TaxID=447962 RepID=A0AAD5UAP0_9FUNG|nr:kti12, chromatin associated [Clydaea vesicula]
MPLIIICGLPSSGKTTRANEIKTFLETNLKNLENSSMKKEVIVVDDKFLQFHSKSIYSSKENILLNISLFSFTLLFLFNNLQLILIDQSDEKKLRGALLSATERYQLYCICKELNTSCCVVYCAIQTELAKQYNNQKQNPEEQYDEITFNELVERFEEPDQKFRWDKPLFTILPDNPNAGEFFGKDLIDHIVFSKTLVPNFATIVKPLTEPNYLYQLDKITQEIIQSILQVQKEGFSGGYFTVKNAKEKIFLPSRNFTLPELVRLKRQFIQINKLHTLIGENKIAECFVVYLNKVTLIMAFFTTIHQNASVTGGDPLIEKNSNYDYGLFFSKLLADIDTKFNLMEQNWSIEYNVKLIYGSKSYLICGAKKPFFNAKLEDADQLKLF